MTSTAQRTAITTFILFIGGSTAWGAGALVACVQPGSDADWIAGTSSTAPPYAQYRCRFQGSLTLPYDRTGRSYAYDLPVWIMTPARLADGDGTALVDPLHPLAALSGMAVPSGAEGEQPLALKMLGPGFIFARGLTWVGVRSSAEVLGVRDTDLLFDHRYTAGHGVALGSVAAPAGLAGTVSQAMIADLADALRTGALTLAGQDHPIRFAAITRVIAQGDSYTAHVLRRLLDDPPSASNGGGAHHIPLFDGWLIVSGGGTYPQWPVIAGNGTADFRADVTRVDPPAAQKGLVFELGCEEDLSPQFDPVGNEFVRYPDAPAQRSYEVAGGSHAAWGTLSVMGLRGALFAPEAADSLRAIATVSGVPASFTLPWTDASSCGDGHPLGCVNPLDWQPVVRALLVSLEDWIVTGAEPPADAWLLSASGTPRWGDGTTRADALGNAVGGVRLPDVALGRGTFYALDPDSPYAGGLPLPIFGAYVDRSADIDDWSRFDSAYAAQADSLVQAGFLLPADRDALVNALPH